MKQETEIYFDHAEEVFVHRETGWFDPSLNNLRADLKRRKLEIPFHPFLSNRYVLEKVRI